MLELELVRKEDREVIDKAEKFFEPLHRGHSHFQIENFILSDDEFPLPDDKYWQAMMETYGRYENLIQYHYEYRKLKNEILLLEDDIDCINKAYEISDKRRGVLIDMKNDEIYFKKLSMKRIERNVKDTLREMKSFLICMSKVEPHLKYKDYESKEKEHWLRRYHIQKNKGERTCSIPEGMLLEEGTKKPLEVK